jgi:hypothetical protein
MMESEQQTYLANPQRRYVEINPAIIAIERLIIRQYEQYNMQKSTQPRNNQQLDSKTSAALSPTMPSSQTEPTKENSFVGSITHGST